MGQDSWCVPLSVAPSTRGILDPPHFHATSRAELESTAVRWGLFSLGLDVSQQASHRTFSRSRENPLLSSDSLFPPRLVDGNVFVKEKWFQLQGKGIQLSIKSNEIHVFHKAQTRVCVRAHKVTFVPREGHGSAPGGLFCQSADYSLRVGTGCSRLHNHCSVFR